MGAQVRDEIQCPRARVATERAVNDVLDFSARHIDFSFALSFVINVSEPT